MQNDPNIKSKKFSTTTRDELKKVVWPTGAQVAKNTAVTIGFVLIISVVLIILNLGFDFMSSKYYGYTLGIEEVSKHEEVLPSDDEVSGENLAEVSGENLEDVSGDDLSESEDVLDEVSGETEAE